jgi:sensor histidine kinase YesM
MINPIPKPYSHQYLFAQLFFWGAYLLVNIIFISLWSTPSGFAAGIMFGLSVLLGLASHGLREIYHRHGSNRSLGQLTLHLLWLLPLAALTVQLVLHLCIYVLLQLFPSQSAGLQPVSTSSFIGYSINTTIMLTLWSILFLLRSEFNKRRNAEIAHWRDQAKLRDMELQFLRSQINSHFLFNSLNNLRSLILEDPQAARQGLADLATLLRGLLQAKTISTVSLHEELDWVRGYLALEALQFEQRLEYEIAIDDSLLNAKIPPLLVQTLVENAVKHGIAGRRKGGLIRLSAQLLDDKNWQLEVTNPAAELPALHQGNGIGLTNTRERLAMVFGEHAALDLRLGETVVATARIPLTLTSKK